jgi:hypothetical protein
MIFTKPEAKYNSIIEKYKKEREIPKISSPIEYRGKKYWEVLFFAASIFNTPKKTIKGIVFIDEKDNVVSDKSAGRELTRLFYDVELLFSDSYLKNLSKSIASEDSLKAEEAQAEFFGENMLLLSAKNIEGADIVKDIISRLPQLKRNNNAAIEKFIEKTKAYNQKDMLVNDSILFDVKTLYIDTLMKNFEKIKLIGTGRNYYGDIKREVLKLFKTKSIGTMGSKMSGSAVRIDYELNHLMQVVGVYEKVINLSPTEYKKYLMDLEKANINEKIELNRV